MSATAVLVVDDDPNTRYVVESFCRDRHDLRLHFATDGQAALTFLDKRKVNLVLTDVRMPVMAGDELLNRIKQRTPRLPVIVMTSYGSIQDAVEFLRLGAEDYLTKPLTRDVFLHRLDRVREKLSLAHELAELRDTVRTHDDLVLIGQSPAILDVVAKIPTIAQTDACIMIYGESGTGKEIVANLIHQASRRTAGPFITVNCASLPEQLLESELFGYKRGAFTDAQQDTPGLVDAAKHGTLFLDEIGEISPSVQVKLLRFLQQKEYKPLGSPTAKIGDVRIIAATNRDLRAHMERGQFRSDLFYRLNVIPIELVPLRERPGDVALLATYFLERFTRRLGRDVVFESSAVLTALERQHWPGNVRELEHRIEQLVVMAVDGVIRTKDVLHPALSTARSTSTANTTLRRRALGTYKVEKQGVLRRFEREYLEHLLKEESGHLSHAAHRAGMDRKNLWQLLRRHGLTAIEFRKSRRENKEPRQAKIRARRIKTI